MAKKKSKAKKDEIRPGVKFPSKDELRKMYSTPDDLRLTILKDKLNEILSRFTRMSEQEQNEVAEIKEEINQINK